MKKIFSALLLAAIAAVPASSQKTPGNFKYYLPKTEVRMSILVEKTTFTPGQLADYADIYFKNKSSNTPTVSYRIVGASLTTNGIPDTDKEYNLIIDKKHSILSIDCDKNGVLKAINTKGTEEKAIRPFTPTRKPQPLDPHDYMSQDILASGNLPKMAQMIAQEIYDIRDSRNQLARGEAEFMPKDGEQLKIMLSQLDTQERALMQMFDGTTETDTTETIITFVPKKEMNKIIVFRFSKHFGLTDSDDMSGKPFYAVINDENILAEAPSVDEEIKKSKDELQLGINLPGKIRISITDGSQTIAALNTYAAQYGKVELLNGTLFGKKMTSMLVLDPTTGNVVSLETKPLE